MQILLQNIIQAIRSLRTQAWQVAISSVGLAVGIVCLAFSANWLWVETNYDSFRSDYEQMYVLEMTDSVKNISVPKIAWKEFVELKRQTEDEFFKLGIVRCETDDWFLTTSKGYNELHPFTMQEMDTTAMKILLKMIHGGRVQGLRNVGNDLIITDKAAMRVFGKTDVVGEMLYADGYPFPITGVCAANEGASNFEFDAIRHVWPGNMEATGYTQLNFNVIVQTADPEHALERMSFYRHEGQDSVCWNLIPLRMFPKLCPEAMQMQWKKYSFVEGYFYNIAFCIISLLLVISAVSNLIMVFTSINLARVREYALRRSMGATAWQNVEWILIGIVPTLIISMMLSGVIMEWIIKLADVPWDISDINSFLYMSEAAVVVLCLLGMSYPIWRLRCAYRSSFLGYGDGGRSHQWLIVVQCMACAFLLFLSLGMQRQISGMINAELGFDTKNILRLHTNWENPEGYTRYFNFGRIYKDLVQEFGRETASGVVDVIPMETDIFNRWARNTIIVVDENIFEQTKSIDVFTLPRIKMDFVEIPFRATDFFNIRLKNGQKMMQDEESPERMQVYFNSEAMKLVAPDGTPKMDFYSVRLGSNYRYSYNPDKGPAHWENKLLNIKDVTELRTTDFYTAAAPTMYLGVEEFHPCRNERHDAIYIKYADGRREDAEAAVRKVLAKFDVPEEQYMLTTFEEYIKGTYKKDVFIANLLSALTVFSIVITLAGVFSMLLYSLRLRRRSMAIHRVMGATFKDIFVPTLRPYIIYAVVGCVIAYFPAYILMRKWMEYFYYGKTPGVLLMFAILASMCAIITLIVWWQVSLCMKDKPVEILKPEA